MRDDGQCVSTSCIGTRWGVPSPSNDPSGASGTGGDSSTSMNMGDGGLVGLAVVGAVGLIDLFTHLGGSSDSLQTPAVASFASPEFTTYQPLPTWEQGVGNLVQLNQTPETDPFGQQGGSRSSNQASTSEPDDPDKQSHEERLQHVDFDADGLLAPPGLASYDSLLPSGAGMRAGSPDEQLMWRSSEPPSDFDDFGDKLSEELRKKGVEKLLETETRERLTSFARLGTFGRGLGSVVATGWKAFGILSTLYEVYENIAETSEDRKLRALGEHQGTIYQPPNQGSVPSERIQE
jgi:hypothetical protein